MSFSAREKSAVSLVLYLISFYWPLPPPLSSLATLPSQTVSVSLPDGEYELYLYQTDSSAGDSRVDMAALEERTGIVQSSIPEKKSTDAAFAYGTGKEVLTQAYVYSEAVLGKFCASAAGFEGDNVEKCEAGMRAGLDIFYRMLSTYGLRGSISTPKAGSRTPQVIVDVPFCSALPVGVGTTASPTGGSFVPPDNANKKVVVSFHVLTCSFISLRCFQLLCASARVPMCRIEFHLLTPPPLPIAVAVPQRERDDMSTPSSDRIPSTRMVRSSQEGTTWQPDHFQPNRHESGGDTEATFGDAGFYAPSSAQANAFRREEARGPDVSSKLAR